MRCDQDVYEHYQLQRVNDLLEQVERLKQIDASGDPRLQIDASMAVTELYTTLSEFL